MRNFNIYKNPYADYDIKSTDILFHAVFDDSPEAIFLLDGNDFRIFECNRTAIELFQAEKKTDLLNLQSFELYNSEPAGFSKDMIIKEINRGGEYKQELTFRTLKENIFWGSISKKKVQLNGKMIIILRIKKIIEYIKAAETLATLIKNTSKLTGVLYLRKLTELLANTFETKYCYIARILDNKKHRAETIKFWSANVAGKNFAFDYSESPCANVIKGYITFYPQNLQEMFPGDQLIASMGIESFIGAPIYNNHEKPMGMLVLMDDKPMQEKPNSRYILSIFASRAGAELERIHAEKLLRKQTQELMRLNLMKDKFLKIVTHDLKNPFNSIMGFSELLRKEIKRYNKTRIQEMVTIIDDSVKNSCTILDNLTAWSKIQRDDLTFKPENLDFRKISDYFIKYFKNYAIRKGLSITSNFRKEVLVYADSDMVNTVIRNLISNAIKFTGKKGKISIGAKQNCENVEVIIRDTGIGMNKNKVNAVQMKETGDFNSSSEKENGTGLGLIICRDFIKRNGGRIWIESEAGKGTKVHFTLPAANTES
jgi:signal transduction histidine kinase